MSALGSCSVCGRLCSGGLCEESPCPSAWGHGPPRRESGPWQWSGCTDADADPYDHGCLMHGGYFYLRSDVSDPRTRCTAQDAQRAER